MAKFQIPSEPSFSALMRKLEVTDPAHADLFNGMFQQLLENDVYNNKKAEMESFIMNPVEGIRYQLGVDEQGVFLQEVVDGVVYLTKTAEESDTVTVTMENTTYGVKNASDKAEKVPEGGIVFSMTD